MSRVDTEQWREAEDGELIEAGRQYRIGNDPLVRSSPHATWAVKVWGTIVYVRQDPEPEPETEPDIIATTRDRLTDALRRALHAEKDQGRGFDELGWFDDDTGPYPLVCIDGWVRLDRIAQSLIESGILGDVWEAGEEAGNENQLAAYWGSGGADPNPFDGDPYRCIFPAGHDGGHSHGITFRTANRDRCEDRRTPFDDEEES